MIWMLAGDDVWPLTGAEPSVESIVIAAIGLAVHLDFGFIDASIENPIRWVINVLEGRDWDAPRDLAGDVPVLDVLEVMDENLLLAGWVEFDLPCFENLDGALSKWFDIDEPLFLEKWLNSSAALVAVTNRVSDFLFTS